MNKTKMMLAVTGGVIGLAVLVMAYFTWSAFSAKTAALEGGEGTEGLKAVESRAESLSRKEIYPCAASLKAIESNRTVLVEWTDEASKLARRGDRVFAKTTPAAFKEYLVSDAKRLTFMTNAAGNVVMKPDFAFGPFGDYISGGKLPAEAALPALQRKWDDVVTVVETLVQCGIAELKGVDFAAAVAEEPKDKGQKAKDKGKKKPAANRKAAKTPQTPQTSQTPQTLSYVFTFATRPAAFVKVLNAFVVSERFVTVRDFSFNRPKDAIVEKLGGEEKQQAAASAAPTGRRRRRGAAPAVEEEKKNEEDGNAKGVVITDPAQDDPFVVTLTVNVRDFGSLEEDKVEEVKK